MAESRKETAAWLIGYQLSSHTSTRNFSKLLSGARERGILDSTVITTETVEGLRKEAGMWKSPRFNQSQRLTDPVCNNQKQYSPGLADRFDTFTLCKKCFCRKLDTHKACEYKQWPTLTMRRLSEPCGAIDYQMYAYRRVTLYIEELISRYQRHLIHM